MTTHHNTQPLQGNSPTQLDDIRAALMGEFHFNTSLTEQEKFRVRQRAQHIHDITQQEFDWLVTLTFKYKKTDHDEVVSLGTKFFDLLSADLYGRRSKKRIIHFSAIERHKDGSLHIHALIKQPKPDNPIGAMEVQDLIRRNWYEVASTNLDVSSSGNDLERYWFRPINPTELFQVGQYITKDCYRYDDTIIYDLCCLTGRKVV
ncbi:hypothetical protein ACBP82_05020 [Paenalcaligenes hominis]|uniref:rolling circle replication-associated protein n=1 Tax=Paenalcaligenes hominis TaxID=643674 RepID=UPI003526AF63